MSYQKEMNEIITLAQAIVAQFASHHALTIELQISRIPTILKQLRGLAIREWWPLIKLEKDTFSYREICDIDQRKFRITLYPDIIRFHLSQQTDQDLRAEVAFHVYHECYHILEDCKYAKNREELSLFCYEYAITEVIKDQDPDYYLTHHHQFPSEVRANLYATKQALLYLEDHGVEQIKGLYQARKTNLRRYDKPFYEIELMGAFHKIIKHDPILKPIFLIMYNPDGSLKNITELFRDIDIDPNSPAIWYQNKLVAPNLFDRMLQYVTINDSMYFSRMDQRSKREKDVILASVARLITEFDEMIQQGFRPQSQFLYDAFTLIQHYLSNDQKQLRKCLSNYDKT